MSAGFLRLFVALDIGNEVRDGLTAEIRVLKRAHSKVKWVAPDHIHLTLAFLGETPEERLPDIIAALDVVARTAATFSCVVKGLGWFGSERSPRVVWAGVAEEPALMALQGGVAEALRQIGFTPEDRPFHPHLTVGRVKSSRDALGLAEVLTKRSEVTFGVMKVDRISVMRSQLSPRGPVYSALHAALLPCGI